MSLTISVPGQLPSTAAGSPTRIVTWPSRLQAKARKGAPCLVSSSSRSFWTCCTTDEELSLRAGIYPDFSLPLSEAALHKRAKALAASRARAQERAHAVQQRAKQVVWFCIAALELFACIWFPSATNLLKSLLHPMLVSQHSSMPIIGHGIQRAAEILVGAICAALGYWAPAVIGGAFKFYDAAIHGHEDQFHSLLASILRLEQSCICIEASLVSLKSRLRELQQQHLDSDQYGEQCKVSRSTRLQGGSPMQTN